MDNQRYWLCCGSTDAEHKAEKSGKCQEAVCGHPEYCNYGTKEEQALYLNNQSNGKDETNA